MEAEPEALGDFASAAARRYPSVTSWQIWNEPNLEHHLAPQWTRAERAVLSPAAAQQYRSMLNAAYAALKAVNPRNKVIAGGRTRPMATRPG